MRPLAAILVAAVLAACQTTQKTYGEYASGNEAAKETAAQIIDKVRGNTVDFYPQYNWKPGYYIHDRGKLSGFYYYYFYKTMNKIAMVTDSGQKIVDYATDGNRICFTAENSSSEPVCAQVLYSSKKYERFPVSNIWIFGSDGRKIMRSAARLRDGVDFDHRLSAGLLGGYSYPGDASDNLAFADKVRQTDR